jgi:hypothetical protein
VELAGDCVVELIEDAGDGEGSGVRLLLRYSPGGDPGA